MTKPLLIEVPDDQFERWRREASLHGKTVTEWLMHQGEYQAHLATIQTLPLSIPADPDLGSVCEENNLSAAFLNAPENRHLKECLLGKLYILQVEAGTRPCDEGDKLVAKLLADNRWETLGLDASTLSTPHFIALLHRFQIRTCVMTVEDAAPIDDEALAEADRRAAKAMESLKNQPL
ncbi:MAG: hypothetical protein AWU57_282 [Marinobacter sp. T13-3]|nr:MAG: hypothetical protein AWU57_282 [Marinobacter sp. T13-3]